MELHEAAGFAEAVVDIAGGGELACKDIVLGREHYSDAGMQGSLVDGMVANGDAGDIGDAVPGAGGHGAWNDAVITDQHQCTVS